MSKIKYPRIFVWIGLSIATAWLILTCNIPAVADAPKHYDELKFPALSEIKLPKYERYQLKNGMVVYLMEDHQLPLVTGAATIRTGSRLEPPEKIGLAEITGQLMRSGGTLKHSADELNQILEQKAAAIESGITLASGNTSFNSLNEDLDVVFKLFAEVIRDPAFAPDKLELIETQLKGNISRRNDDPESIVNREFYKLIYGETSPYARTIEYSTLDNISREDVIEFYRRYVRPENIILGIVGDFQREKMKNLISEAFGDWQSNPTEKDVIPSAAQKSPDGIFFVDRPQLNQSSILLGHIGGMLNSKDYPALTVLNEVLNGLSGRLVNEVRSRQGLAYSVSGYWDAEFDFPGLFIAGGQTKSSTTVPFIKSVMSEVERIRSAPISEDELNFAKESILNSFIFNFDTPNEVLSRLMRYEYYGYPQDFIFKYQNAVKATSVRDVQRVAEKYLQPEQIVTLVVGNSKEIQPPLTSLNPEIKTVDITIPQPKTARSN